MEKKVIGDRVFHDILRELRRRSTIDENNGFADSIYRKASLEL